MRTNQNMNAIEFAWNHQEVLSEIDQSVWQVLAVAAFGRDTSVLRYKVKTSRLYLFGNFSYIYFSGKASMCSTIYNLEHNLLNALPVRNNKELI